MRNIIGLQQKLGTDLSFNNFIQLSTTLFNGDITVNDTTAQSKCQYMHCQKNSFFKKGIYNAVNKTNTQTSAYTLWTLRTVGI